MVKNLLESHRFVSLIGSCLFRLRLQAVNHVGAGTFSHPVQFFTKELPPSAPSLNASSTSYHSLKLKWGDSGSSKKSLLVQSHTLQVQNRSGRYDWILFYIIFLGWVRCFCCCCLLLLFCCCCFVCLFVFVVFCLCFFCLFVVVFVVVLFVLFFWGVVVILI